MSVRKGPVTVRSNEGAFDVVKAQHDLKERNQRIKEANAEEDRVRRSKEAAQHLHHRNVLFWVGVISLSGILSLALAMSFTADNDDTLAFARGLVTLIVGGMLGGVAGYLTGKQSR